jgi:UDP-N-acetyl-D-galactosamine dehydrogenase
MKTNKNYKIAVIGQGYVGLPLALEFSKHLPVYGFDINKLRIEELKNGEDHTLEADSQEIKELLQKLLKPILKKDIFHHILLKKSQKQMYIS